MQQLAEVLIENGMRFSTGIGITDPQPMLALHLHEVGRNYWYNDLGSLASQLECWERSVKSLARRPHFARAAIARGGIVALALRHFFEPQFTLRPSLSALKHGSPAPVHVDGRVLHDDWLTQGEEDLILGYPHPSALRSLLPPTRVFNKFYGGVFSSGVENWFNLRMRELKYGVRTTTGHEAKTALTAKEWKHVLRDASRSWYN
ncbi:hypothetical protein AURDEDRAFT_175022 [Auricularia subglabra TFB-10046 SS5]|nr:hypothetical protein AURDEDRAFT_175022 [Auricularia subglabra TFB-10046 SS5]